MGTLRKKPKPFGSAPNGLLNDERISFKAKGIFCFIESKPDGWEFSEERIAKQTKDGISSVRSGIKELIEFGYLERSLNRNDKGYVKSEYILEWNPTLDFPRLDNPTLENNMHISNKENSNKERERENSIFLKPESEKIELKDAFSILKYQNPILYEQGFAMEFNKHLSKMKPQEWRNLIDGFNDKFDIEVETKGLTYAPKVILRRLRGYTRSYIKNYKESSILNTGLQKGSL